MESYIITYTIQNNDQIIRVIHKIIMPSRYKYALRIRPN